MPTHSAAMIDDDTVRRVGGQAVVGIGVAVVDGHGQTTEAQSVGGYPLSRHGRAIGVRQCRWASWRGT